MFYALSHARPFLPAPVTVAGLALALLVPLALILWFRARAYRAGSDVAAGAAFAFARRVQWTVTGGWLAWLAFVTGGAATRVADLLPFGNEWRAVAMMAIALVPPASVAVAAAVFAHPVWRRLRGAEFTLGETVVQTALQVGASLGLLGGLGVAFLMFLTGHARFGIGAAVAALALLAGLTQARIALARENAEALTSGELRDRLFALAAEAKVKLRQFYVVPMRRARIANAFAVRNNVVMVTDHLLEHLSCREVDAVLAHEITHLQHGHPKKLALALGAGVALSVVTPLPLPGLVAVPVSILAAIVFVYFMSRRFEWTADAGAVRLTGDPEAMISALARLNHLNHVPLEWGSWSERWLTHPSTRRRAEAIARIGGIAPGRVAELLRGEPSADPHYEVAAENAAPPVFSTAFKARTMASVGWTMLSLYGLAAAGTVAIATRAGVPRGGLFALVALAVIAVTLLATNLLSTRPYRRLCRELPARLADEGFRLDDAHAQFVGLAPDAEPRLYEHFSDWDVGMLVLTRQHLSYVGERTRFTLLRAHVRQVRLVGGLPGWLPVRRVLVTWRDDGRGLEGTLNLRDAASRTLLAVTPDARRLLARIEAWRDAADPDAPALPPIVAGPPRFGEVTSVSPHSLATARTLPAKVLLVTLLVAGASALFGLPLAPWRPGFADALAGALIALMFQRWPLWRYRDREMPQGTELRRAA
jgi:Zn-dependent protease with chaperone function